MTFRDRTQPSIFGRAVLAIGLLLGFYVLAVAFAVLLLFVPYASVVYFHRIFIAPTIACIVAAFAILAAAIPRRNVFTPPGPVLKEDEQPKLFEVLRGIARATGQEMPGEVYCTLEMNAWVSQRGGVLGIGGHRTMGLGLPLMSILSTDQFRAVLAHEFGHFHRGDTRLVALIYRTRAAITRTLDGLQGTNSRLLRMPFIWYGNWFLRLTTSVSRRQEHIADELAATTVGAEPLGAALRLLHVASGRYGMYWYHDVVPLLERGLYAPIAEGVHLAIGSHESRQLMEIELDAALQESEKNPYDTHPPLGERLSNLGIDQKRKDPSSDPAAITLVSDPDARELEALLHILPPPSRSKLTKIPWADVTEKVWVPAWTETVRQERRTLIGLTPAGIPVFARNLERMYSTLIGKGMAPDSVQRLIWKASRTAGIAMILALRARGWEVRAEPGHEVQCCRNETQIRPLTVIPRIAKKELSDADWQAICVDAGIADLSLLEGADAGAAAYDESALVSDTIRCPFCNSLVELNEEEELRGSFQCPYCGMPVTLSPSVSQATQLVGEITCPTCSTVLEFDEAELTLREHVCPSCGHSFNLTGGRNEDRNPVPAEVCCPSCGNWLALDDDERVKGRYTCPICQTNVRLG